MIRRLENADAHVWTAPLVINKSTGVKFGKSEDGAIWLDPQKTSVYKFYQFWLNVDDMGAIDYTKIYTLLTKEQIEELAEKQTANPAARDVQKALAYEVTKLVHGEQAAESASRGTAVLFGDVKFEDLSLQDLKLLSQEIPSCGVGAVGAAVVDLLVDNNLVSSKGEARRLILGGAISINGEKILDDKIILGPSLLKKGKNSFLLVR